MSDVLRNALEHIAGSCEGRAAEVAKVALDQPSAAPIAHSAQPDERVAFDVALNALDEYRANWDTGTAQPYAQSERIAMECAVEAVRDALNEARFSVAIAGSAQPDELAAMQAAYAEYHKVLPIDFDDFKSGWLSAMKWQARAAVTQADAAQPDTETTLYGAPCGDFCARAVVRSDAAQLDECAALTGAPGAIYLRALIAQDSHADAFQTIAEYREALLKSTHPVEFYDDETPHWYFDVPSFPTLEKMTWRGVEVEDWIEANIKPAFDRLTAQLESVRAAVAQAGAAQGVPAGFKLVPIEPTPEMLTAARPQYSSSGAGSDSVNVSRYRKMLSAAPQSVSAPSVDAASGDGATAWPNDPATTGVGQFCQPGDQSEPRWLLTFDDADRNSCMYDTEAEARKAFATAEGSGWNCWLLSPTPRATASDAPAVVQTSEARDELKFSDWWENHRDDDWGCAVPRKTAFNIWCGIVKEFSKRSIANYPIYQAGRLDALSAPPAVAQPSEAGQLDADTVTRLKLLCRLLNLETAFPDELYADPEALFTIFGRMRSKIEALAARPSSPVDVAASIHYPEHWDTAAYPTVESAMSEVFAWFKCSECGTGAANQVPASSPVEAGARKPVAWTLQEEIDKRESTWRAHLWFTDPQNTAWTPLYTKPQAGAALTDEQRVAIGFALSFLEEKATTTFRKEQCRILRAILTIASDSAKDKP